MKIKILKAHYAGAYKLLLFFSNGKQKVVDFMPLFSKYVHGYYTKFITPASFKKFYVNEGNVYWGKK